MPKVNIEVQIDSIEEMDRVTDKVCEVIRNHHYVGEATIKVGQTNSPWLVAIRKELQAINKNKKNKWKSLEKRIADLETNAQSQRKFTQKILRILKKWGATIA